MAQICRDLNNLNIDNYFQDVPGLISLIDARNLKFASFKFGFRNSKFLDIQSLDIGNDLLCLKELAMLIEKTKGNIFDISVYTYNKSAENIGKNLACLYLHGLDKNDDIGDELLNILTKFSPETLTEIEVSGYWKYSIDTFENFFKSYKGRKSLHFEIIDDYDWRPYYKQNI
ncbi:hypothetical protein C1646_770331 [Rhizophagus diaphanus]|nr:hypothetical protein C1646_770331 [Rhizophagus diaphanus] [Rhizophagus sp. MUCL 43196]